LRDADVALYQAKAAGRSCYQLFHQDRGTPSSPEMSMLCAASGQAMELPLEVVLPMHRNPPVRDSVIPALSGNPNVRLVEPLGYLNYIATLADAAGVVTDSGGVQEEAPSLGVAVSWSLATRRNVRGRSRPAARVWSGQIPMRWWPRFARS
jgi:UDP-N-acetylglucosamine 2-epimerase